MAQSNCALCGETFQAQPANQRYTLKFCSDECRYLSKSNPPAVERFWRYVKKGETPDSHWLWTGSLAGRDYGRLRVDNLKVSAHRFSWELHNGPIPDGMWVLHNCAPLPDCAQCVNPEHLYLGDHKTNVLDALAKHQHAHGENHGNHKLTEIQVIAMRQAYHFLGYTFAQLAKQYSISHETIARIIKGFYWKHLPVTPEALNQFLKEHPSFQQTHSLVVR